MDKPKAPDDAKNWESIDIYLFSNGQKCSPPRKYHLRCEELKLWDATLCSLAHSHYGSMHSNIELFTLDGKKIYSPLELKNDMAYVAVKPPDAFISAGYEKYLIKASRSFEKRQEKILCNCAIAKTGDNKCIEDCKKESIIALNANKNATTVDNEVFLKSKTVVENLCPNCETSMPVKEYNNLPENYCHKQTSKEIQKCDIKRINSNCSKRNKKDQILFKKKDTSINNKNEVNNHIKPLTTPDNSISHVMKTRQFKDKIKQKTPAVEKNSKINSQIEVGTISNDTIQANHNEELKDNLKNKMYNNSQVKSRSDIVSNMFNNLDNSTPSLFMDENRNLIELESKLEDIPEFYSSKINETFTISTNKNDNRTNLIEKKDQEQNTDILNKEGKLNIFLNINLKDYVTTTNNESKPSLNKDSSEIRVLSHRASQLNIDVMLSKGGRHFNNNVLQLEKPLECDTKNIEDFETTVGHTGGNKVTIIRCKCDSKNNMLTERYAKELTNFVFLLPIVKEKGHSNGDITSEMVDKEIQVPSTPNCEEEEVKKEAQGDSTLRNKFDEECKKGKVSEFSENEEIRKNTPTIICKSPSDMFTQTDWCNLLLQAIRHEDGHYSFRLPTLALLKQYNINN